MRLILSVLTGATAAVFATGLGAQEKKSAPKKEPAPRKTLLPAPERCFGEEGKVECRVFRRSDQDSALMKRAALGLQLTGTGSLRDTLGVFVARVTPKGPAENAGIIEGDRIVSINGVDLRVNPADAEDSYASGLPSRRLSREVAKLSPGAAVNVRVYSGGRIRDVRVTAGRASDLREAGAFGFFDGFGSNGFIMGDMPNFERMRIPLERMRQLEGMKVPLERLRELEGMKVPLERLREMDLPRTRLEEGQRRMLVEKMRSPLMRIEGMPRLRDGTQFRVLSPSRVRLMEPEVIYLDSDGNIITDSAKKANAEKARKAKKK